MFNMGNLCCISMMKIIFENVSVKSKKFKKITRIQKPYQSKQIVHVLFFQFLTLSALLHRSVSLSPCERLSWKCKLSSQHALALAALFWFLSSSLTRFYFLLVPLLPLNFPLHSVLDRFCLYHKHHLICFGKYRYIVHIWRALIDLYSVITPFSIVS